MPLPKCVKVEITDSQARRDLLNGGYRYIGTMFTYHGRVRQKTDKHVENWSGVMVEPLVRSIRWSGRLWKDHEIPSDLAMKETVKFVGRHRAFVLGNNPAVFGVFDADRILLVGVHPAAIGLGLAQRIIRHVSDGEMVAGTYSDNGPAQCLYESLGMKIIKKQWVFHK